MLRIVPFLVLLVGCKEITSFVVGESVEVGKEVTTGIVEGIDEGRKAGESVDGAVLVSSAADLDAVGVVSVHTVEASADGASVLLAFENSGDKPLRISNLEVLALDPDGFVQRPTGSVGNLTVPPRAKDRLAVTFAVPPEKVTTVRVWGKDLPVAVE